jgi:DNA-binding HxlR family transcriptional regulator
MVILDLLSRRWALRILWELHIHDPCSFRNLQKLCGDISPTVLNSRLKELREAGIIGLKDRKGYIITGDGLELGKILIQLNDWAKSWGRHGTSAGASEIAKQSSSGTKNKK